MEQEQTTPHVQNFSDLFTLAVMDGLETANMDPNLDCTVDLYIASSRRDKAFNTNSSASLSVVDSAFKTEHKLTVKTDRRAFNCRTANGCTVLRNYVTLYVVDQDYPGDHQPTKFAHKLLR